MSTDTLTESLRQFIRCKVALCWNYSIIKRKKSSALRQYVEQYLNMSHDITHT